MFLDPGGDAVWDIGYFNTISGAGTVSFDNTQQVVGVGSYKFDSGAGGDPCVAQATGVLSHNPSVFSSRRVSCYFRYDSVPDSFTTTAEFVAANIVYSGGGFNGGAQSVTDALNIDDGLYATATPAKNGGQGSVFGSLGFDDDIPVGAAIDSVKIIYERKYDVNTSIGISRVKYRIQGFEGPDYDNTDMPLTDTVVTVELTDRGFTREDLLNGVFEVIAEARRGDTDTAHTQSWDYVKVEVEWHLDGIIAATDSVWANDGPESFKIGLSRSGSEARLRFVDGLGASFLGVTRLFPNTDYRLSFAYVQRNTVGVNDLDINIFVNHILELSIENASTDGDAIFNLRYGWLDSPGVDHRCWFDQFYIDDGDDLQDPGNMLSTAKLPAAVNENNWNTTVGTGAVNERPLDLANRMVHTANSLLRQTYTLQTAAAGDVDISSESFIGYMGWAWARLSSPSFDNIGLVVNGVEIDRTSEAIQGNAGSAPMLFTAAAASVSYPSNAAGVGMISNEFLADTLFYEGGVVVAYEGPPNPDILLERQLVNNETLDTITDNNLGGITSYEICWQVQEFGGFATMEVYSIESEGASPQQQGVMQSSGGGGRLRITPGIEVQLVVGVSGVTMIQIWRRINFE